jgi:hypothetical protein
VSSLAAKALRVLGTLWAGSLWALALWVAPLSFRLAPDRHAAGIIAGGLFRVETYLTLSVAVVALWRHGRQRCRAIYLAAALLLINEWVIRYLMDYVKVKGEVLGMGFGAFHGLSAALYGIACLATLSSVWNDDFR